MGNHSQGEAPQARVEFLQVGYDVLGGTDMADVRTTECFNIGFAKVEPVVDRTFVVCEINRIVLQTVGEFFKVASRTGTSEIGIDIWAIGIVVVVDFRNGDSEVEDVQGVAQHARQVDVADIVVLADCLQDRPVLLMLDPGFADRVLQDPTLQLPAGCTLNQAQSNAVTLPGAEALEDEVVAFPVN